MEEVDEIWHAGDIGSFDVIGWFPEGKIHRIITGNIDDHSIRERFPEELVFEVGGLRVLMLHIGGNPARYAKGVKARIREVKAGLFVCGHSHICRVEYDRGLECLYMNPGAIGMQGFHQVRTMLKFSIIEGKPTDLRVIELGKKRMPSSN
ncbi:putative phosphoesterase [Lunatimonas lonarensis]|uniref:Putative phosphoesterase n=1 Tax=Lunatimonas lonarensis TaxID=1232681 RepID=R7ZWN9_9BACT|nr:putative phosphoesterase [Lunatimonas lonarensis]